METIRPALSLSKGFRSFGASSRQDLRGVNSLPPDQHPDLRRCRLKITFAREGRTLYLVYMHYRDIITIEPGKRSGKPCIRGMRITVTDILEYLASGMSIPEILGDFPELTEDDIRACLAFAADREKRLVVAVA